MVAIISDTLFETISEYSHDSFGHCRGNSGDFPANQPSASSWETSAQCAGYSLVHHSRIWRCAPVLFWGGGNNGYRHFRSLHWNVIELFPAPTGRNGCSGCLVSAGWSNSSYSAEIHANFAENFLGKLISLRGDVGWPAHSSDLAPCDFFLWGYLKSKVYTHRPENLQAPKDDIRREIAAIRPAMTERVMRAFRKRLEECIANDGHHLGDIIFKTWWQKLFYISFLVLQRNFLYLLQFL